MDARVEQTEAFNWLVAEGWDVEITHNQDPDSITVCATRLGEGMDDIVAFVRSTLHEALIDVAQATGWKGSLQE